MEPTIQDAMAEMLGALHFDAMARDVRTETELDRLQLYARVIVKNTPEPNKLKVANLFRMHRPRLF